MPFDAVFLSAVADELRQKVLLSKVDKVYQPARDVVILQLRSPQGNTRLLIAAGPGHARIHLTEAAAENPETPPMFCMLLRKHLVGGKITDIRQPAMERMLDITLDCTDEMGVAVQKHLVAELMGRNSNLILSGPDGRIIDCLRRVDYEMSEQRQVLPGLFYHNPPSQEKRNPLETDLATLEAMVCAIDRPQQADRWLNEQFTGLSPLICRELAHDFCGETDPDLSLWDEGRRRSFAASLHAAFAAIGRGAVTPTLLMKQDKPSDYTYRPIAQYGQLIRTVPCSSFSALLDRYYAERDRSELLRQKSQAIHKAVVNLRDRTARKLAAQRKELEATYDRDRLRQLGDIVTANLHRMERGQTRLICEDFYDPDQKQIEISLSPLLSPQQNAAKFYKDYTKAKNAEKFLTEQIAKGETELVYLSSILDELTRTESARDIAEIRQELVDGGYLREARSGKKKQKPQPSRPLAFRSSDGWPIYVGRNNRQNDLLTLKTALRNDLWLHTQKIHGSHVIIACDQGDPPDSTVTEAAMLAAYYSQAREGQNVPVDYTRVRNVKKPAGAKPGMVIYDHYNTAYVTPDPALAEQLKVK